MKFNTFSFDSRPTEDDRPPKSDRKFTPSPSRGHLSDRTTELIPQPTVTIMVESPQDAPLNDFPNDRPTQQASTSDDTEQYDPQPTQSHETVIDIDAPIDVNMPRDTTNIFYDYSPDNDSSSISNNQTRRRSSSSLGQRSPAGSTNADSSSSAEVASATNADSTIIDIGADSITPTTSAS